ncbi:MAG: Gfo/Idh/MocA family oxidoreductase [Magnetococcales bacterium]|nr:Gfo/Idh/MocA family oxidoreductase [Magnetococcales bacterium]
MKPGHTIRVAVLGAGPMGRNHLRIYSQLRGIELVGVVDPDPDRLRFATSSFGCPGFPDASQLPDSIDAASIATPPATHAELGILLMNRGVHCLIEKPLATSTDQCQALIDAARNNKVILLVGHVERFNPAIRELTRLLTSGPRILALDARRMSHASSRITDVDVIADLMVHDLDLVMNLVQRPIVRVTAGNVRTTDSPGSDHVCALLGFEGGILATITASRITRHRVRQLSVTADMGWITADLIAQELCIFRQGVGIAASGASGTACPVDHSLERVMVRHAEPLALELQHFIDCVQGEAQPLVTGQQAFAVLEMAETIRRSATEKS